MALNIDPHEALLRAGGKDLIHVADHARPVPSRGRSTEPWASLHYFAQFSFHSKPRDIFERYLAWVLGVGPFDKTRQRRIDVGVPATWSLKRVLGDEGDGVFNGEGAKGCIVRSRWDESTGLGLIAFRHTANSRLQNSQPNSWIETFVRIGQEPNNLAFTLVQHAIGARGEADSPNPFQGGMPSILESLLKEIEIEGQGPILKPMSVASDDTEGYLVHQLLDEDRRLPHLVLTKYRRTHDWATRIDPFVLAKKLGGMAQVVVVEPGPQGNEFQTTMERRGVAKPLSCFDGGARLYLPSFRASDSPSDHPLWTKLFFQRLGDKSSPALVRRAGNTVARLLMPKDLPVAIESFDRERRQARVLSEIPKQNLDDDLRKKFNDLEMLFNEAETENKGLREEVQKLSVDAERSASRIEDLEAQIQWHDEESQYTDEGGLDEPEDRQLLISILGGRPSLEESLRFLKTAFPDRLIVLDSAITSAQKASDFRFPDAAWAMLKKLVLEYWSAMASGGGDAKARGIFGREEYAAKEANLTTRGKKLRTFPCAGKNVVFEQHLKFGTSEHTAEGLRVYFNWDGRNKKIVIGHCGAHLDF